MSSDEVVVVVRAKAMRAAMISGLRVQVWVSMQNSELMQDCALTILKERRL